MSTNLLHQQRICNIQIPVFTPFRFLGDGILVTCTHILAFLSVGGNAGGELVFLKFGVLQYTLRTRLQYSNTILFEGAATPPASGIYRCAVSFPWPSIQLFSILISSGHEVPPRTCHCWLTPLSCRGQVSTEECLSCSQ